MIDLERTVVSHELILLGRIEAVYRLDATPMQLAKWKQIRHELAAEDNDGWSKYEHLVPIVAAMIAEADR